LAEAFSSVFRRIKGVEVAPVNKQDEVPTFVPETPDTRSFTKSPKQTKPLYETDLPKNTADAPPPKADMSAALRAYKETLNIANPEESTQPQFSTPKKPYYEKPEEFVPKAAVAPKTEPQPGSQRKKPLSSVKLAETIAAINREREGSTKQ
jgi:hypothetical protein